MPDISVIGLCGIRFSSSGSSSAHPRHAHPSVMVCAVWQCSIWHEVYSKGEGGGSALGAPGGGDDAADTPGSDRCHNRSSPGSMPILALSPCAGCSEPPPEDATALGAMSTSSKSATSLKRQLGFFSTIGVKPPQRFGAGQSSRRLSQRRVLRCTLGPCRSIHPSKGLLFFFFWLSGHESTYYSSTYLAWLVESLMATTAVRWKSFCFIYASDKCVCCGSWSVEHIVREPDKVVRRGIVAILAVVGDTHDDGLRAVA